MAEEENNVAANETGEVATTPIETNTESTSETETSNAAAPAEDVTQTQAFAKRLKEETEKNVASGVQAKLDAFYEKNYGDSNGVHSEADYNAAMEKQNAEQAEAAKQARNDNLTKSGINPTDIEDLIANNEIVKKASSYVSKKEAKDFVEKDNQEFLDYFKQENNRDFDAVKDILPTEVWQENKIYQESLGAKGKRFLDIYKLHENSILKAKLKELEKGSTTSLSNTENAASSTGSVTGNGSNKDVALTPEMVNSLSPKELSKRWKEVRELFKMK
jgi:hypothetical protein